ncbi:IQ calmodulin-binding motif protein [Serendipita vermifera]|nr:IQ calmodulin-binding motif protein [Serendipita vermifera]
MISDSVYDLCHGSVTVSSELAKDPTLAPGDVYKKLYGKSIRNAQSKKPSRQLTDSVSQPELKRAEECGHWGPTKPSELFLRMYHDALCALDQSVESAVISPPLIGSYGVIPLTIMSTVPDIMRHMSNLIVRAEKEVIIATNYWMSSVASTFVTNALRELSNRLAQRGGRVVVKIMYDRGSPWQLFDNHQNVDEATYTSSAVNLPPSKDIPNIDLQVINFHKPMLGTFHAKFMITDRKYGLIQSNNIQDNSNFEMACEIEGPIVDSLYDMFLISWNNKLVPPSPTANTPAAGGGSKAPVDSATSQQQKPDPTDNVPVPSDTSNKDKNGKEIKGVQVTDPGDGNTARDDPSRKTSAVWTTSPIGDLSPGSDLRTANFLAGGQSIVPQSQIDHPSKDNTLPEHTTEDPHYDVDIAGEVARVQSAVSPKPGETRMEAVTRHLNHTVNKDFKGDAPDDPSSEAMTPYIPHPTLEPFPIAMVNRHPYGPFKNDSVYTPQNEAWLSGLRNAKKSVFIQSPNLNAGPIIPAILDACRRGVDVYCWICLGYNDIGELLPGQGGTNEMVVHKLYQSLEPQYKKNLHWFWYVAKDMMEPIVASKKIRTNHIKLMIVDEQVGIQGSGNQDTQTWYHSQEVNIMFDSAVMCRNWMDGLRRNQNTHLYGQVSQEDGVWKDKDGKEVDGVLGTNVGSFSWTKGLMGAVRRVRGTGGF